MNNVVTLVDNPWVVKALELAVAVLVVLAIAVVAHRLLLRNVEDRETRRRIRKAVNRGAIGLVILSAAVVFSSNLGSLGVSLGVASAGIAFALQSVIANAAARLANVTGSYYRVGDRVQVGAVTGDVVSINLMVTTLMEIGAWVKADQYSRRLVHVSNSAIFTSPVYNYSADLPILWDEITIPIKYGGDRALAVEILTRVVEEVTREDTESAKRHWAALEEKFDVEDARIEPLVTLAANDNWLEYNVRYVTRFNRRRTVKDALFNRIMDELDRVPDKLGIASSTYDIVAFPPVNVTLSGQRAAPADA